MPCDDRDVLEVLIEELDFIEKGGYGRSVKTPWQPTSIFQDSLSCLNFGYPYRAHPCSECFLTDFVPPEGVAEPVPCHHIPLNDAGETLETLESLDNQKRMEETVKNWLRGRIRQIQEERATDPSQPPTAISG
jgi:hypothetical protein